MTTLATGFPRRLSLRAALRIDAVVTAANGLAYLLAAEPLGDLLGIAPTLLRPLGAVLAAFAAVLWLISARPVVARPAALAIVAVNAAWTLGSIVVAIGGWTTPTTVGTLWILAQAIVVASLAELQATALRR